MESTLVHTEDFRTPAQKKQLRNLLRHYFGRQRPTNKYSKTTAQIFFLSK